MKADTYDCTCGALEHARKNKLPRVVHSPYCKVAWDARRAELMQLHKKP